MRTAGHVVDADLEAIEDHDDWAKLHDELSIAARIVPRAAGPLLPRRIDSGTSRRAPALPAGNHSKPAGARPGEVEGQARKAGIEPLVGIRRRRATLRSNPALLRRPGPRRL